MNKTQSPMTNALIKAIEEHNNRLPYNGGIIAYRDEQKVMANGKEIIIENDNIYFVDTTGEKYALENCTYGCIKNAIKMVTDAFTPKTKIVRFEITSRVLVENMYNDEMAIQRAIDKITKNPEGYLCHDNVMSVEDDTEMPYNPDYDNQ